MQGALSRLAAGPDANFDGEEGDADVHTACTIKAVSLQLNPTDPGTLAKESAKDAVIANVMRYIREGWPPKDASNENMQVVKWKFVASWQFHYLQLMVASCIWIQSDDSPKTAASGTALREFWDAVNEITGSHCSQLARDGCRSSIVLKIAQATPLSNIS